MARLTQNINEQDHIQGNKNAPITLVEYGDFECPHCGHAYPIIKEIQEYFGDNLRFVYRHFPLAEMHPMAKPAAEACEFAAKYGKFWEMHDLIFENQESLSLQLLVDLASSIGLNAVEMKKALDQHEFDLKIKKDFLEGAKSGVNGTPSFFINGQKYEGEYEFEAIKSAIEELLVK
jgi:protein-disulfide isomerase